MTMVAAIAMLIAYSQVCAQGEPVRFEVAGDGIPGRSPPNPGMRRAVEA